MVDTLGTECSVVEIGEPSLGVEGRTRNQVGRYCRPVWCGEARQTALVEKEDPERRCESARSDGVSPVSQGIFDYEFRRHAT